MTDQEPLLSVKGLRVVRETPIGTADLVTGIDLVVRPGETVGIVGESGSGKSLTARAVTGLLPPGLTASGDIQFAGRQLLGRKDRHWQSVRGSEGLGMVLQDPFTMLNPVMRCGRIIDESVAQRAQSKAARKDETIRRLAEVGITDASVVERYPFQLSGGMRQRVAIAAALAPDPNLLIADEPSTALDATTQREVLALLKRIQAARNMSLVLITHDLRVAFSMCDRVYVLYAGSVLEVAPANQLDHEPLHPYSNALLLSEPPVGRRLPEMVAIPGSVPAPEDVAGMCTFVTRCKWASAECRTPAVLREVELGRWSACNRLDEVRNQMLFERMRSETPAPPREKSEAASSVLEVHNVRKVFETRGHPVTALHDVSIEVSDGEGVGLVGESGSGKTTLGRMLVGLEQPSSGTLSIGGVDVTDWRKLSGPDRAKVRASVQMVFQDPYSTLNPMHSIGAALAEAITTHAPKAKQVARAVDELLTTVGLPGDYAQRRPAALSGGMRQRVAIARALAANPRVLVCDEPVSALDVSVQAQVLNLLNRLRDERGIGYLFITHDLSIVRQVTERLYVMFKGRIVESGETDAVLDEPQHEYTRRLLEAAPRPDKQWLG